MTRRSFPSSRGTREQSPTRVHVLPSTSASAPSNAGGATAVPLSSHLAQQRTALCDALTNLTEAWRAVDLRDEREWSAFAADAALSVARFLIQHAATVHGVTMERDDARRWTGSGAPEELPSAVNSCPSANLVNPGMDASPDVSAAKAADAAALAFLGVVDALSPAAAMSEIVDAAVTLGLIDGDSGTAVTADIDESSRGVRVARVAI